MEPGQKKAMASMIVGMRDKPTFTSEVSGSNDGEGDGYADDNMEEGTNQAAEEMIAAFESKDPVALKEALKSFIEMCK